LPPIATHSSEIRYLFDQPNAPFAAALNAEQEALAAKMRAAWTSFAAGRDPSSAAVRWPSFDESAAALSLVTPQPRLETNSAAIHHCSFWAAS
jgi:para-nitrobenzyl esterase